MSAVSAVFGAYGLTLLVNVALKATLVLLLAAGATALMHRTSAASRHLVWCVAVLGVLALPLLSLALPAWEVGVLPGGPHGTVAPAMASGSLADPSPLPVGSTPPTTDSDATGATGAAGAVPAGAWSPYGWLPALTMGFALGGVLVGLLWLAAGVWGTRRIGQRAEAIRDTEWLEATQEVADRLGLRRRVRMLRSRGAAMPATWGLIRPSVILPAEADRWPDERRRAVLAHEFAHVKRFDCVTQTAAHLACALFWWHPVIWYAARRLCVERERACDDLVLRTGARASAYATQLLEIARTHRTHRLASPLLVSLAKPSQLESRLLWILDGSRSRSAPSRRVALLTVVLGLVLVGPLAAIKPVEVANADAPAEPRVPEPEAAVVETAPAVPADFARRPDTPDPDASDPEHRTGATAAPVATATETAVDTPRISQRRGPSEGDRAVEELIRMRIHGVTPEFIGQMEQLGYSGLSIDLLVTMRIHGVSPAFIREMEAVGYPGLSPDRLVAMRIHGVSSAFVREMEAVGYSGLSLDDLVRMRIHGVDAALVRELREAGFEDLSLDALVRLRISGVDRELIESGRRRGPGSRSI